MMVTVAPEWKCHGGKGPHLLLVHGYLSSRSQWLLNLDALSEFCQPVTLELFGHAHSPSPKDPDCYRPDYYVACFEHIREALGADRWFVLGYSLGAGLTIRYALDYPERVIGHLFTNSTSALADAERLAEWRTSAADTANRIRTDGQSALRRIPVHPQHAWRLPDVVKSALLEDADLHDPEGIAHTLEVTNPNATVRERLQENVRPACLLFGEKEKRFHAYKAFAETNMPMLDVVTLNAGHGMNMEDSAGFNMAVRDFFNRCVTL
jgi:pimeloyl-ACP methyl ester carboxylesterase